MGTALCSAVLLPLPGDEVVGGKAYGALFSDEFPSNWESGPAPPLPKKRSSAAPTRGYYGRELEWLTVVALVALGLVLFSRRTHYQHLIANARNTMIAKVQMANAATGIRLYCLATNHLPTDVAPYFEMKKSWFRPRRPGFDPWGNAYQLEGTAVRFTLGCAGPDGEWQTADDLYRTTRVGD